MFTILLAPALLWTQVKDRSHIDLDLAILPSDVISIEILPSLKAEIRGFCWISIFLKIFRALDLPLII